MLSEKDKAKIKEGFCDADNRYFGVYCNNPDQLVENEKEILILIAGTCDIPVSLNDLIWLKQFGQEIKVEATSDFVKNDYSDWPSSLLLIRIIK